jgi:hypothetical protein
MIHLGFAVCSQGTQMHRDFFSTWGHLRHFQLRDAAGADLTTVGILGTPRDDGERDRVGRSRPRQIR